MNWTPYPFIKEQWETSGIKLHLGCGNIYLNDFVNIDIDNPVADANYDVLKLPYKDNSVSLILASHLIEHFKWQDHIPLLKEWNRVLIPGCWLIIEAPNLEMSCKLFLEETNNLRRVHHNFPQIFGRPDFSASNIHLSGVWHTYLFDILKQTNFSQAVAMPPIQNDISNKCLRVDGRK